MTEADIERAVAEDPDASLTTAGDWKDARVVEPQTMEPVTLRLDRDVLAWFRRQGRGIRRVSMRSFAPSSRRKSASRPVPSSGSGTTAPLVPVRGGDRTAPGRATPPCRDRCGSGRAAPPCRRRSPISR